jgi:hypothetical protein
VGERGSDQVIGCDGGERHSGIPPNPVAMFVASRGEDWSAPVKEAAS